MDYKKGWGHIIEIIPPEEMIPEEKKAIISVALRSENKDEFLMFVSMLGLDAHVPSH